MGLSAFNRRRRAQGQLVAEPEITPTATQDVLAAPPEPPAAEPPAPVEAEVQSANEEAGADSSRQSRPKKGS